MTNQKLKRKPTGPSVKRRLDDLDEGDYFPNDWIEVAVVCLGITIVCLGVAVLVNMGDVI